MKSEPIRIRPGKTGRLIVLLPYTTERVEKIKTVAGRRWHQGERYWTVPHTDSTLSQLQRSLSGSRARWIIALVRSRA